MNIGLDVDVEVGSRGSRDITLIVVDLFFITSKYWTLKPFCVCLASSMLDVQTDVDLQHFSPSVHTERNCFGVESFRTN